MITKLAASLCAVILILVAQAAQAALITHGFVGEVVFGPELGATGAGTFSYEDSGVTGIGEEFIHVSDGLQIEFTFLGQVFRESDDIDFPLFPELVLLNGTPVFLDWIVANGDGIGTEILAPGVFAFLTNELIPLAGAPGFFTPIVTVPMPGTLSLTLVGVAALIAALRLAARRV